MVENSKVVPMRPLREVLRDYEALIDDEAEDAPKDGPCRRCNGTGSEVIYNEQTRTTSARRCAH